MGSEIQIGLIGGSRLLREALEKRLSAEQSIVVSLVLDDVQSALNLCSTQAVQVWFVLATDLREDELEGLISSTLPGSRIVLFGRNFLANFQVLAALLAGRLQWLESDASYALMLATLKLPASVDSACSPQLLAAAAKEIQFRGQLRPSDHQCQANTLTGRERQIAELAAGGLINKQIAKQLGIGITTVKSHLSSAMRKLEVQRRGDIQRRVGLHHRSRPGASHTVRHCAIA